MEISQDELLQLMHAAQDSVYAAAAPNAPRRRFSLSGCLGTALWWGFLLCVAGMLLLLTADHFKMIPQSLIDKVLPPAQVMLNTPAGASQPPVAPRQQPPAIFSSRPGAAPQAEPAPVFAADLPGATATATPMPTEEGEFWTPEEQTAFAIEATATTTAFYEDIPTAEPAFVQYVGEQCKDEAKVRASWMLQQMCAGAGDE